MFIVSTRFIFLAIMFMTVALTDADAAQQQAAFMPVTGPTSQPIGHYRFCQESPQECAATGAGRLAVSLNERLWQQLIDVNSAVNRAIQPITDADLFGEPEVWYYPTVAGDCEDYVLLKRRELINLGWPAGALLITVVRRMDGEGHAVLTVRTDRGDLILDNLQPEIRPWHETSYLYIKRQSDLDAGRWVGIADDRGLVVGTIKP